ncbi:P22 phage major capsid protein family protein [Streptomyces sp. ME02-6977A]|uniref:P22 phage major capsid protein family protein n=1 Tax=Streptomyces sp. ME02-6977A TaxID=3028671 RepID=UPI0029AC21A3|nr:P22 phage major capsid protein family protein [Streptomyces sp. ME02-6977A]MDX3405531.1 P22 phage major capsid protein family protein [Streptomyces sp. ME02-6977A]
MAISAFKPEVWNANLLVALEKSHVYAAAGVVNRDYEGDIANYGDTVHITSLVEPTIGTYTPHTDITIEDVDDVDATLLIDQSKYFAFEVDDVEKRQAFNGGKVLTEQARKAAYKLRDTADKYVAGLMAAGVDAGNLVAEATLADPGDAYDLLVDLGTLLDESDVPDEGRWTVVTPAYYGLLKKDTRFVGTGDAQAAMTRTNGIVGEAAGFSIRKSNNAPDGPGAGAGKLIIAGYNGAVTYAEQINKTEATRKEKGFADIVKGLHLYGSKVVRPVGLAAADVII